MLARVFQSAPSAVRHAKSTKPRRISRPLLQSASLFTATIGLGTCPKRRSKQSNEESGEDAYYINSTLKDRVSAGVFDGVGGWASSGVDPSIFSRGLARHCEQASHKEASPLRILTSGYDALQRDKSVAMGSSTACMASVDLNTGLLSIANLGDSGYVILDIDAGHVVHASKPQTYYFNCPYQLAKVPASMRSSGSIDNAPKDADVSQHQLGLNHVVILATDGFFDNVYIKDAGKILVKVAREAKTKKEIVDTVALKLRDAARTAGRSDKNGPFAEEARAHRQRYAGGKEDDICIIVMALDVEPVKAKL